MSMKHSVDDLRSLVYQLYPRGLWPAEPGYSDSEEHRRMLAVRRRAGEHDSPWRAMLDRIKARLPECDIENRSLHLCAEDYDICYCASLKLPTAMCDSDERSRALGLLVSFVVPYYLIYSSRFAYCPRGGGSPMGPKSDLQAHPDEPLDELAFAHEMEDRASNRELLPPADSIAHCIIYAEPDSPFLDPRDREFDLFREIRFELRSDEQPYARAVAEEIEAAFPGYEPMPPEIGKVLVPDVVAGAGDMRKSTLYDCLFRFE
jgi:hypothetical protein